MASVQLKFLLMCASILFSTAAKGVNAQCTVPPKNQVVYEGDTNMIMTCSSPVKVSWTITPTNNEQFPSKITNFSDTVVPSLTTFFSVAQTDLTINTATNPVGTGTSPMATSGIYIAQYSTSCSSRIGAKLIILRAGPTCNCTENNSTSNSLTCSVTYADASFNPIYAKVTWTADGSLYKIDILNTTTKVNNAFTSTSTITVGVNDPRTFQCNLTFTKPQSVSAPYIATNAPAFSAICNPNCVTAQCRTPPINQAVYEGDVNTIMTCNSDSSNVSWTVTPTNNELFPSQITNFSDTVTPSLTTFYAVSQTDLTIKTATNPVGTGTSPMATSGVYIAQYSTSSSSRVGAKLVVVRAGPTCNCTAINSKSNNLTCSITYADASFNPIYAKMTWTAGGNSTTLNVRAKVNNAFTSTSTITVDVNDPRTFQCNLTFTTPQGVSAPYIATNAPAFSAICNPNCEQISPQCQLNVKNIAVREGQTNTIMNLYIDPQNVSWKVLSTSDELSTYTIINYGGAMDPTLTGLYDVNETGLIIKDATTNGFPISTAGLYIGQCVNNPNKTGVKLIVVRSGPLCSCTPVDYHASSVSCNVTYADSTLHPIYAIVTWKLNGVFLASYTLPRTRIDAYVFYSESTLTRNGGTCDSYECELTFAEPTDIQFAYVATNAPEFNESCSTTACGQ